jgi:uncharacterized phage infection (PIP) family protein YhgE
MPNAAAGIADLLAKNMDWPGATEISERLKKMLPPGLADDPKGKAPLPPEVQAQMQQMSKMVEGLTAELNKAKEPLELKRMEIESKERMHFADLETKAAMKLAELQSKEAVSLLQSEIQTAQGQLQGLQQQITELDEHGKMLGMGQPLPELEEEQPAAPMQGAPPQDPNAPQADGGLPADVGQGALPPTGGASPGQPIEGNS